MGSLEEFASTARACGFDSPAPPCTDLELSHVDVGEVSVASSQTQNEREEHDLVLPFHVLHLPLQGRAQAHC